MLFRDSGRRSASIERDIMKEPGPTTYEIKSCFSPEGTVYNSKFKNNAAPKIVPSTTKRFFDLLNNNLNNKNVPGP